MLRKCSSGHIEFSFEIPAQFFPVNSKFFLVNVQNWWQVSYPKIFFPNFFRTDTYATVSTNVPLIFHKKSKFLCSKSEQLKKTVFQSKVPTNVSSKHMHCCFGSPRLLICHGTKKNWCRSKVLTKNKVSLVKELIFRKTFLWTRGWHLWRLWKNFLNEALIFLSQIPRKFGTMCKASNMFFPQSLPRLRRLQFWHFWRTFPTEWTEDFAQNPKNLVSFSLFRKDFL